MLVFLVNYRVYSFRTVFRYLLVKFFFIFCQKFSIEIHESVVIFLLLKGIFI